MHREKQFIVKKGTETKQSIRSQLKRYAVLLSALASFEIGFIASYRYGYSSFVSNNQATEEITEKRKAMDKSLKKMEDAEKRIISSVKEIEKSERALSKVKGDTDKISEKIAKWALERAAYRAGWIDPRADQIREIISTVAKWKRRFGYPWDHHGIGYLYHFSTQLRPRNICDAGMHERTIKEIMESGEADSSERLRVLASLALGSGLNIRYASCEDHSFLLIMVAKYASQKEIRKINEELAKTARSEGVKKPRIVGTMFGKDYYIVCDPSEQQLPGLINEKHLRGKIILGNFDFIDY